jgi:uncharacterized protein YecE (DUF72 family)
MVLVGTSGYNYPEWRDRFYPPKLPAREMLPFYAARFGTVEINATFYRMPTEATVAGWASVTPGHFVFALKAPQRITHMRRLLDVDDTVRRFVDVAVTLGPKLGPLLFQLPPTFRKDTSRLRGLLALLPRDRRVAFEFRHPSWYDSDVYAALAVHEAALCIADTEDGTTPDVATASWGYLRLRDRDYAEGELDRWADSARRAQWRDAFVYFKHEETAAGAHLAMRFLERVQPAGER